MIQLQNRTRTIQCFNLPHAEQFLQNVEVRLSEHLPDGTHGTRELTKRLPRSITILAGETVEVADAVGESAEVKSALDRGVIRLIQLPQIVPSTPAPAEAKSPYSNKQRR